MPPSALELVPEEIAHSLTDPYDIPEIPVRFLRLVEKVRRSIREVIPADYARLAAKSGALLIDVREFTEWRAGRLPQAIHIPRGLLEVRIEQAVPELATPILCYCADGLRSTLAAESLQRLGYRHVSSLAGGFLAWEAAGLPVAGRFCWD